MGSSSAVVSSSLSAASGSRSDSGGEEESSVVVPSSVPSVESSLVSGGSTSSGVRVEPAPVDRKRCLVEKEVEYPSSLRAASEDRQEDDTEDEDLRTVRGTKRTVRETNRNMV